MRNNAKKFLKLREEYGRGSLSTQEASEQGIGSGIARARDQVAKAIEPELKQVTFVAMKQGIDAHGDYVSLSEIRIAKESFNKQLSAQRKLANLWHIYPTDKFDIIESYLLPADATLNGTFVEKGTWLVSLQILDDEMWELIKSNEINGISIGAVAKVQNIDEE